MPAYERREFAGTAQATVLASSFAATDTTFTVAAGGGAGHPTGSVGPFLMTIDRGKASEERVLCSTRAADTFTVSGGLAGRGQEGTVASTHAAPAAVEHTAGKRDFDEANAHIADTTLDHHTQYLTAARHAAVTHTAGMIGSGAVTLAKLAADVTDLIFGIGDIKWQAHDTPISARWVVADGSAVSRATFAALFALIGTRYGTGDGSTTFNIPNLVGAQLEGVASNAGVANKTADSHAHTKSGSVSSANVAHSHGGATQSGGPGNHDHNDFDGTTPSTTGGQNQSLAHTHPVSSDNASHAHGDSIAYAAASVSNVTKAVPFVRVS